jgi:hypothetical protein
MANISALSATRPYMMTVGNHEAYLAIGGRVILTPPCIIIISDSPYKIYRAASE